MAKEKTHYGVACSKCGFVFNKYTASTRKESVQLRSDDGGQEVKNHDLEQHGSDLSWYETTEIQIKTKRAPSATTEIARSGEQALSRIILLAAVLVGLSACGENVAPADEGLTASTPAPLTVVDHYNVAATLMLAGNPVQITYDHSLFSDQSITVTGTISGITPGTDTRTFTMANDGGNHGEWYDTNPAIFNAATEQWTICVDKTHANHIFIDRQPYGHRDSTGAWILGNGNGWYVPIGGSEPDLVSFPGPS